MKTLDATPSNPVKQFDDLVLEDIAGEKVVSLLNDHGCRIPKKGMIPNNSGWNQENPTDYNDIYKYPMPPIFESMTCG